MFGSTIHCKQWFTHINRYILWHKFGLPDACNSARLEFCLQIAQTALFGSAAQPADKTPGRCESGHKCMDHIVFFHPASKA